MSNPSDEAVNSKWERIYFLVFRSSKLESGAFGSALQAAGFTGGYL